MRHDSVLTAFGLLTVAAQLFGCGSEVTQDGTGAASTGGTGAASTGGAGAQGGTQSGGGSADECDGDEPLCADACGSDYFPEEAVCEDGTWTCPPGTVDPEDCPPGTCWGSPLPCEVCTDDGWACEPTVECVVSNANPGEFSDCADLACATCVGAPASVIVGGCACACDDLGQYSCAMAPGCCNTDLDCGDFVYAPCVNGVCKMAPPTGKCWSNADCVSMGMVCAAPSVCPCGEDCPGTDQLGDCVAI